jgi:hypothetical protein
MQVRQRRARFLYGTLEITMQTTVKKVYSPDGLWYIEVRDTPGILVNTGAGEVPATELWRVHVKTKKAEGLLRGKENADIKKTLAGFSAPCFSPDGRTLYFLSAAWATSNSVQKLDLQTRRVQFVIDGDDIQVIARGPSRGMLLVERALIKLDKQGESLGRGHFVWIVAPGGKAIKELGPADSRPVEAFKKRYARPNSD